MVIDKHLLYTHYGYEIVNTNSGRCYIHVVKQFMDFNLKQTNDCPETRWTEKKTLKKKKLCKNWIGLLEVYTHIE